jgi:DNA integrity scanning protein DisA with diadenylate cyclase activity
LEVIVRLAAIDGALVVDQNGTIQNAGVILDVPPEHTSAGEGARTAATSYASTRGIAVKVSVAAGAQQLTAIDPRYRSGGGHRAPALAVSAVGRS